MRSTPCVAVQNLYSLDITGRSIVYIYKKGGGNKSKGKVRTSGNRHGEISEQRKGQRLWVDRCNKITRSWEMWDEFGGGFAGFECLEESATPRHATQQGMCVYTRRKVDHEIRRAVRISQSLLPKYSHPYCHMRVIWWASNTSAL